MDVPDKPADPNEVELTEGNKKTPPEKNNKKRKLGDEKRFFHGDSK